MNNLMTTCHSLPLILQLSPEHPAQSASRHNITKYILPATQAIGLEPFDLDGLI
jgi:hypothetical protein